MASVTTREKVFAWIAGLGLASISAWLLLRRSSESSAELGWEVSNLGNNGADGYVLVNDDIYITRMLVSFSCMILSLPNSPGIIEVLTDIAITDGQPQFSSGVQAYIIPPSDTRFLSPSFYNPNRLSIGSSPFLRNIIYSDIAKSFVSSNGDGGAVNKIVEVEVNRKVLSGQYIVFHMDAANSTGAPLDAELQVTLFFK